MANDPVLIAGAGPIGYTTALLLARRGIPFVLFEGGDKIFDDPRAARSIRRRSSCSRRAA